jgi:hypothetical protein
MTSFREELRSRRRGADLSLSALARGTFYSAGYLSKIENGQKPATRDLAMRCDAVLNAGGALVRLVPPDADRRGPGRPPKGSGGRPPVAAPDPFLTALDPAAALTAGIPGSIAPAGPELAGLELAGFGSAGPGAVGAFGGLLAGGYTAWSDPGNMPAAAAAAAADESCLPLLGAAFEQARLFGHQFSPRPVLAWVRALTGWVRVLADNAPDPALAVRLALLAARSAEYAGWMAQELGDDDAAAAWTRLAVSWAVGAGDVELSWFALIRAADIALYRQDAAKIIEVTRRAQAAAPAKVGSVAAQREAQGHALLGDYDACRRALDRAAELAAAPDPEPGAGPAGAGQRGGPWGGSWPGAAAIGSTSIADSLAITTGWSMFDLGRCGEAAEILDREVPRISPIALRARARFGLRGALAHAAAGNLERACELLNLLIGDIARADSATIRVDLRRVVQELSRWRNHPAAADLLPRLSAVLRGPYGQV